VLITKENGQFAPEILVQKKTVAIITLAVIVWLLAIAYFAVPYIVANGLDGSTPFDNPAYSVLSVGMSEGNGNNCYLTVVILNIGNVNIKSLSAKLNGSELWHINSTIGPGKMYSTVYSGFYADSADFLCPNFVNVGQSYYFFMEGVFADGKNQTLSTTVYITPLFGAIYRQY
jgi:hypothetical protein